MIKAFIVDDEKLAREGIRLMLAKEPDVEIVGEAADGPSATRAIAKLMPDLVFLDVRMPGYDGFEILDRVGGLHGPRVIFTTAYDQYAVQAFEAHAIDYLLKPISFQRLAAALQRARSEMGKEAGDVEPVPAAPQSAEPHPQALPNIRRIIVVKDRDRFLVLKTTDVDWFESAANYVQLHAHRRSFFVRATMNEVETQLKGLSFARIHRSTIVNLDRVSEIRPSPHGDYQVHLHDGTVLRLSRAYRDDLLP